MSGNKAALKAAKTALDAEKWDEAITQAQIVLASDSQNYFAKLFLGRAFEKKGSVDEAAKAYQSAAKIKPDDTQGWLGLCSLYESQGSKKVDEYREAAVHVAGMFAHANDKHRCQTTIDKLTSFAKQHGSTAQYKRALEVLLPGSPVYDFLEGRIPHPSHTYTRIAEITEDEEKQRINKEIGERRTRLGATIGQVTAEVKREVLGRSNLEEIYQNLIDWTNDDEVRRQYEEKLLIRAYDTLVVLPNQQKVAKREQVLKLAHGMVIIKHPFRLAWDLHLEWQDVANLQHLDVGILQEYMEFFPESGLGKVFRAFLGTEDRLLLMGEGLEEAKRSVLAHRLVGEYYLHLEEYESAVETSRNGLKVLLAEEQKSGLKLQDNKDALNSTLATALVHYQAPRNHPESKSIFEEILARKQKFTPALIGIGLILEEQEEFTEAYNFLTQALEQDPGNVRVGAEAAWCDALSGNYAQAVEKLEHYLPAMKTDDPKARDSRAQTLYRIGICIWERDPSRAARKDRGGAYARFLAAIKTNVNFAPAYASLGFYYADYAKDKKRARQCFQKAFELSASEVEAAERLARAFADQSEWDIVEIIAQRVVDSGKTRPAPGSKKKGISWPYSALGVVQMNKQEYSKAIVSFLSALRISPDDYYSYVGLGESYHNSGRYNSASRTFVYAEEPHDGIEFKVTGDRWFTRYMLANVNRELGEHDAAIKGLQEVLKGRPEEFGVLMALLQTFIERAWRCVETGFFGQAARGAVDALRLAASIASQRPAAFNLWKAVGDACSVFAWVEGNLSLFPAQHVKDLLLKDVDVKEYDNLADVDGIGSDRLDKALSENGVQTGESCPDFLALSLLAYKRAIFACAQDIHAQAVAWYNLGWAEQRTYMTAEPKAGRKFLRAAVRCFKRAIELEAGNSEFWNALGVVTTKLNPKVAQHSFVRSLHLNERSVRTWTNLGVLYLINNDYELAHQAFGRAQSTDPDYAHAWLGEGLIALLMGDSKEALAHFTHAFEISDSSTLVAKRQYAVTLFDALLSGSSTSTDINALIQPLFALQQLHSQAPTEEAFTHLFALLSERVGDHTAAIDALTALCTNAESDYEANESLCARTLAAKDFAGAAENGGTALDLSSDAESSGLDDEARRKLRLSAHLTAGLAGYYLGNMDDAISMFRSALVESNSNPDVVCLLVQVLWAKGGEQERSVAREQLFDTVEKTPEHVGSVVLLGAIAALDGDQDTIDAVKDDLQSLRTSEKVSVRERSAIERVLAAIAALSVTDDAKTQMADEPHPAQMALLNARRAIPPFGSLEAAELAKAFANTGTVADAQRAIVLAPWERSGWETFADALAA
ncbi:Superkiller protein 3 [Taxawa tesnikishii (nom. ined.)]|nr:Superkiller protein 3 [Dothideales sp. JES 119]